jgi:hypothetical protein
LAGKPNEQGAHLKIYTICVMGKKITKKNCMVQRSLSVRPLFEKKNSIAKDTACHNLFVWLVLVRYERKVLLACCWWLVCSETKVLLTGG